MTLVMYRINRLCIILAALLCSLSSAVAQQSGILKDSDGTLLYGDGGEWLTRNKWIEKHSRKEFRKTFGNRVLYDHAQEFGMIRTDIQHSIRLVGEGNIIWERVIESDISRDKLKLAARKRMASVIFESEDKIVGGVIEHGFIRDEEGRPWGVKNAHWKGIVSYEFKEGRYKITLSNIQYKTLRSGSLGIYSLGVSTEKTYIPFANLLYPYSKRASDTRYHRLVDFIDYNFSTSFVLFETKTMSNDW